MAEAAGRFVSVAAQAVRESGRFVVALAGGSTPRRLYELLGTPEYADRVDWARTHVFWGVAAGRLRGSLKGDGGEKHDGK